MVRTVGTGGPPLSQLGMIPSPLGERDRLKIPPEAGVRGKFLVADGYLVRSLAQVFHARNHAEKT